MRWSYSKNIHLPNVCISSYTRQQLFSDKIPFRLVLAIATTYRELTLRINGNTPLTNCTHRTTRELNTMCFGKCVEQNGHQIVYDQIPELAPVLLRFGGHDKHLVPDDCTLYAPCWSSVWWAWWEACWIPFNEQQPVEYNLTVFSSLQLVNKNIDIEKLKAITTPSQHSVKLLK